MARKDPYSLVKVNRRIYEALQKRLEGDNAGAFKLPPMNTYIEQILWDYAQGKITRREAESSGMGGIVRTIEGRFLEVPGSEVPGEAQGKPDQSHGNKRTRRAS